MGFLFCGTHCIIANKYVRLRYLGMNFIRNVALLCIFGRFWGVSTRTTHDERNEPWKKSNSICACMESCRNPYSRRS